MRTSLDQPWVRNGVAGRQADPTSASGSAFGVIPRRALAATWLATMRPLPDTLRPYLADLLAATAGLLGAVGTGRALFATDATGDGAWLHALFLGCTAVMLLGTVRFLVHTMDFPEPIDNAPVGDAPPSDARVRRDEADGAKE